MSDTRGSGACWNMRSVGPDSRGTSRPWSSVSFLSGWPLERSTQMAIS